VGDGDDAGTLTRAAEITGPNLRMRRNWGMRAIMNEEARAGQRREGFYLIKRMEYSEGSDLGEHV